MLFDIIFYILILRFSNTLKLRLMLALVSMTSTFQKHDFIFWKICEKQLVLNFAQFSL